MSTSSPPSQYEKRTLTRPRRWSSSDKGWPKALYARVSSKADLLIREAPPLSFSQLDAKGGCPKICRACCPLVSLHTAPEWQSRYVVETFPKTDGASWLIKGEGRGEAKPKRREREENERRGFDEG